MPVWCNFSEKRNTYNSKLMICSRWKGRRPGEKATSEDQDAPLHTHSHHDRHYRQHSATFGVNRHLTNFKNPFTQLSEGEPTKTAPFYFLVSLWRDGHVVSTLKFYKEIRKEITMYVFFLLACKFILSTLINTCKSSALLRVSQSCPAFLSLAA